jgi:haloalkane dehalogenase
VANPGNVSRIIIMNTWAWPVNRDPYYIGFSAFMGGPVGRFLIRRYNFFARTLMPRLFGDKGKLSRAAHEHYLRPLEPPRDRQGCLVLPRHIIASTPWLAGIWNQVSALNGKPVLIVWGMKDIAFREKELKRWERTFPKARVVRLSKAGHFLQEEAPDELGDAVGSFLKETEPALQGA